MHPPIRHIALVFNLKRKNASDDRYEEYDEAATIQSLVGEIEGFGLRVLPFEQNRALPGKLVRHRPDFVLNIAEGLGPTRSRESQVPCLLESLGLPYSGSDPLALGITLDKVLTRRVLAAAGVDVPALHWVSTAAQLPALRPQFAPGRAGRWIVKPRWEGSSKGVFLDSVVSRWDQARDRVLRVLKTYRQPALVEQFLPGDEITVGLCGNPPRVRVLGMMKIAPAQAGPEPFIYSIENKRDWERKIRYLPQTSIAPALRTRLREAAVRAFEVLELRDIARIDFRLDARGAPKVIDVNPLPGLSPRYSDLPILCRLSGCSYRDLIRGLLTAGLSRCGLSAPGLTGRAR